MQKRKILVVVNGVTTLVSSLLHARLLQGSLLLSILYLFFNLNLVQSVINKNKGSIAIIDDYIAWVTSTSIGANFARLQAKIVPHLENCALSGRATFLAKKTHMIHFTRNKI